MSNFRHRVSYQSAAESEPGRPLRFSSVPIPHSPTPDAGGLAEGMELVLDTESHSVVFIGQEDGRHPGVGTNETGETVNGGSVRADGRWCTVMMGAAAAVHCRLVEATELSVDGQKVFAAADGRTIGSAEPTSE